MQLKLTLPCPSPEIVRLAEDVVAGHPQVDAAELLAKEIIELNRSIQALTSELKSNPEKFVAKKHH
jgi:hypothetical protein